MLLGVISTLWLRNKAFPLWWIVPMALGHFFLFCNVFLVWRKLELIWAVLFTTNVSAHLAFGITDASSPLLCQLPVTICVLVLQIRSPWYHGILAGRLNPQLKDYLGNKL